MESRANPAPRDDEWFHARGKISKTKVRVFVNNSRRASLDIPRLHQSGIGKVRLWLNWIANFASLEVSDK